MRILVQQYFSRSTKTQTTSLNDTFREEGKALSSPLSPEMYALNKIYEILASVDANAKSQAFTDYITVGLAGPAVYPYSKKVKKAIIQNLSTTDTVTVVAIPNTIGLPSRATPVTAGQGTILNPATQSGYGGGSMELGNVDLGQIWIITNNNNSQKVSVYYEV
jgi:hypothetical protein